MGVLKAILYMLIEPFTTQFQLLTMVKKRPFENIVGRKAENAENQHFLRVPQSFLSFLEQTSIFISHLLSSPLAMSEA